MYSTVESLAYLRLSVPSRSRFRVRPANRRPRIVYGADCSPRMGIHRPLVADARLRAVEETALLAPSTITVG